MITAVATITVNGWYTDHLFSIQYVVHTVCRFLVCGRRLQKQPKTVLLIKSACAIKEQPVYFY